MSVGIYKKGQGYWTRMMSAIAAALVVGMGLVWLWDTLATVKVSQPIYVQATAVVTVLAVFGWIGFYLIGRKPKVVDFMIATEGEMKKVNWSTRREIFGSTKVVIALTALIALFCFVVDRLFAGFFAWIDVLKL